MNGILVRRARYLVRRSLALARECKPDHPLHDVIKAAILQHLIEANSLFSEAKAGRRGAKVCT